MSHILGLNVRIIKKLKEAKCDNTTKEFLKEMLFFELENIEQGRPRYKQRYDTMIEKYLKKKSRR